MVEAKKIVDNPRDFIAGFMRSNEVFLQLEERWRLVPDRRAEAIRTRRLNPEDIDDTPITLEDVVDAFWNSPVSQTMLDDYRTRNPIRYNPDQYPSGFASDFNSYLEASKPEPLQAERLRKKLIDELLEDEVVSHPKAAGLLVEYLAADVLRSDIDPNRNMARLQETNQDVTDYSDLV